MKSKIIILNSLTYNKNNKQTTKIEFVFADKQISENYKGLEPIRCYYKGRELHDKIKLDYIGVPLDAIFEERVSYNNPLETTKILKEFRYNQDVISLL